VCLFWGGLFVLFRFREPSHKGKPISYWVNRACRYDASEAVEEVTMIGSPSVPLLISNLHARDTTFRVAYAEFREIAPDWLSNRLPEVPRADEIRCSAERVLGFLGTNAVAAVPDLIQYLKCSTTDEAGNIVTTLAAIGPGAHTAVPDLHAMLTNADSMFLVNVAGALWQIDKETNLVVEICSKALETTNAAGNAALLLSQVGTPAASTAPRLLRALKDPNSDRDLRGNAAIALGELGFNSPEAIEALLAAVNETNSTIRMASARALWEIDKKYADVALPLFVDYAIKWNKQSHQPETLLQMTRNCHVNLGDALAALTKLAQSDNAETKLMAAQALKDLRTYKKEGSIP